MLLTVRNPDGQEARALFHVDGAAPTHAHFERLVSHPRHWRSYSLRDPKQLDHPKNGGFAHGNKAPLVVTYDPVNDPDPRRQDAAKVFIPNGTSNLQNQVRLPISNGREGFLLAWSSWMGREFAFPNGGIGSYKHFQLSSNDQEIWHEVRARFDLGHWRRPGSICLVDVRRYKTAANAYRSVVFDEQRPKEPINYGSDSLGGQLANFDVRPETWTNYFVWVRPRVGDPVWWDWSMWMADETRDPVMLFDRVPVRPNGPDGTDIGWDRFWLEFNTSSGNGNLSRGDLIAYVRNVVQWRANADAEADVLAAMGRP